MMRRRQGRVPRFFRATGCRPSIFCIMVAIAVLCESTLACGPGPTGNGHRSSKTPMSFKQRLPDVDETSINASGSYGGRVRRGSNAFKALVTNYNPLIVFKDDEKNGDDRRMTERCKEKLDRLAEAVKTKWGAKDVKLRVIDAYDVDDSLKRRHGPKSLHHDGRAVDITTSDRDKTKYPELGRMAYESGFDWVSYGSRGYIHASVKSEKAAEQDKTLGCFPETASVRLENGRTKTMKQLQIGDKVASRDGNGRLVYSRVLTFLDYKPNSFFNFITIQTKGPSTEVAITASHLIYQPNKHTQHESVRLARDINAGDFVYVRNGSALERLTAGRVSGVKKKKAKGAYAPLTETGNIVVDNVLCSCYAVMPHQELAHWSFAPLRFADWIFPGIAAQKKHGLHWYAELLFKIYRGWNYIATPFLDNS